MGRSSQNSDSVQISFANIGSPDMSAIAGSFLPFAVWSDAHIAADLPISITYPPEFTKRLETLRCYLARGAWPSFAPNDAKEPLRLFIESIMSETDQDITEGVRLIAAAAIRDDGSRDVDCRQDVLKAFLTSKILAVARVMQYYVLDGEPALLWGDKLLGKPPVGSAKLIYGLAIYVREPHDWAGWTDADIWIKGFKFRIFVPILPRPDILMKTGQLNETDVRRMIVPQLLSHRPINRESVLAVREVLFKEWEAIEQNLHIRSEDFVDSDTCTDGYNAKSRIDKIASERIVSFLGHLPRSERIKQIANMQFSVDGLSSALVRKIRKRIDSN